MAFKKFTRYRHQNRDGNIEVRFNKIARTPVLKRCLVGKLEGLEERSEQKSLLAQKKS